MVEIIVPLVISVRVGQLPLFLRTGVGVCMELKSSHLMRQFQCSMLSGAACTHQGIFAREE